MEHGSYKITKGPERWPGAGEYDLWDGEHNLGGASSLEDAREFFVHKLFNRDTSIPTFGPGIRDAYEAWDRRVTVEPKSEGAWAVVIGE